MPIKQIAARLGVSVGSAHLWTEDIALTSTQRRANLRRPGARAASRARSARCRARRSAYQQEGREHARRGDPLHLAGCMLYWAEGSKEQNSARLSNSDPQILRLFRRFLSDCLQVDDQAVRIAINVCTDNGLTIDEVEGHWLDLLDLQPAHASKHTLDHMPTSSSGRRRGKHPYGVCRLAVYETRVVQHIYGAIQEYAGFEEPRWLG